MKDYSDMDKRRLRRLHRAVHLQDRFITAAHDQGAALYKNARAVVLSCDHLRAGHDLWSGRLRQLKKRVESLEKQADWSSRHTDATITKTRQQLGDAAAYASGAPPTAVVSRPHPAVSTFYQATKRRVAALDEQMEELQAALGGAVSLTSKTGAGGAAHWRNPSVAVKQALQNEHSAIRRMAGGPIQAFRGRLDEVKERFTRMWREREQEDLAREQRMRGVDGAGAAAASLSSGSSGGVPLHRRDPFIEADRKYEAATQLRALEQQSRLDHGEGAFGATDSELENVRRAVVAAREKAGYAGTGTGGTGGGWGSGDSGWGTSGGGSSSSGNSGWGTAGGSDWGASSGSGSGWGTSGGDSGWGTSAAAPSNNDPMSRPQGSLRRSTTRPQMRRQRAGGM